MNNKIRSAISHFLVALLVLVSTLTLSTPSAIAQKLTDAQLEDALFSCLWKKFNKRSPDYVNSLHRDPSDHTRAFDSITGRNFVYDRNKKAWIDARTGKSVTPANLEDALFCCLWHKFNQRSADYVNSLQRDPSDHTRAFDSITGRNFVYDTTKLAWIDVKTGECVCPKCATKPTAPAIPKEQPGKTMTTPSTTGSAKPQSSVTPPRVVPTIPPGRTATGQSTSLRTSTGPIDQCLVGKWRSESVTSDLMGTASKGEGAGILVTIKSDGTQIIDYNGMKPLKGAAGETNQWSGTATGHISTSNGTATIESIGQSELKHKLVAPDGTSSSNSMGSTLGPAGLVNNPLDRSYTCTKDTLTFKDPAHTFTFRRIDN